jgi:hypothetical protein
MSKSKKKQNKDIEKDWTDRLKRRINRENKYSTQEAEAGLRV